MARVLCVAADAVPEDAHPGAPAEWDSLRHLELMLAIEAEFKVRIPTEAMLALQSLPQIEAFLAEQGAS